MLINEKRRESNGTKLPSTRAFPAESSYAAGSALTYNRVSHH